MLGLANQTHGIEHLRQCSNIKLHVTIAPADAGDALGQDLGVVQVGEEHIETGAQSLDLGNNVQKFVSAL